ncbi:MAG: hypothetical protein HYX24_03055 [Candidatus Aenigmarchaeota archaeon]|nr:hypothetical protein [Candidatus Aenigmarchaeota archaeon]
MNKLLFLPLFAVVIVSGCTQPATGGVTAEKASQTQYVPTVTPNCKDAQVPYQEQEEYTKTEYYSETVPYTDRECESKKLVYSITDFAIKSQICNKKIEECIKYLPIIGTCTEKINYCIDRQVVCSVKVNNFDDEPGTWTVRFDFYKDGSNNIIGSDTRNIFVYPHDTTEAGGLTSITEKELLTTTYTCTRVVTVEPTKQVCRDVTKYKQVQKEKQVTAYRPVTKYRTEQKCD